MLLLSSAPRSEHDPDPCSDLEAPAAPNTAAAANIAMHPITGAFADPSHETACAAQLFRMAFPCHASLMVLSQALIAWTAFSAPPGQWPLDSMIVLFSTLGLVGRVLVHRMHDTVRGQRLGSWTWTALVVLIVTIDIFAYVERVARVCPFMPGIEAVAGALVNGSHGLGFWHKLGLIGLMLLDGLWVIAFCGEVALAGEGMLVVGFVVAHLVEMHLRHRYAEKQRQAEDKQRLEGEKRRLETVVEERRGMEVEQLRRSVSEKDTAAYFLW